MNIEFVKQGNAYVAEFKVEADFNLHIEKDKNGHITLYQRTSEGGKYALLEEFGYQDGKLVYESDAAGLIYPKYIKVVSAVLPTYAVVTSAGEVTEIKSQTKEIEVTANGTTEVTPDTGFAYLNSVKVKTNVAQSGEGGGSTGSGGSASAWRYFDVSKLDNSMKPMVLPFIVKVPADNRITLASVVVDWANITACGVDDSPKLYTTTTGIASWSQMMAGEGLTPEVMAQVGIVEITEEEFYTF
jgi:hypothetical protein